MVAEVAAGDGGLGWLRGDGGVGDAGAGRAGAAGPVREFRLPPGLVELGALGVVGCGGEVEYLVRVQDVERRALGLDGCDDRGELVRADPVGRSAAGGRCGVARWSARGVPSAARPAPVPGRPPAGVRGDRGRRGRVCRVTVARQPCAARLTRAWCRAAPQLSVARRASGSVTSRRRLGSRWRSSLSPVMRQRHGWVLWIDGARPAAATASASASATAGEPARTSVGWGAESVVMVASFLVRQSQSLRLKVT